MVSVKPVLVDAVLLVRSFLVTHKQTQSAIFQSVVLLIMAAVIQLISFRAVYPSIF
jgi:phosphate starvation-inducible membrane PsiE